MKVHLIGMGGIGMSGIAQILLSEGHRVCGSDLSGNSLLASIRRQGGEFQVGHQAANLNHPDRVVYSSSITPQNPELLSARNRKIPVMHRGQMLARLVEGRRTVAVTGAHGKSTTTAMAAQLLMTAGLDPTVALGAEVQQLGGNARFGRGRYAVVEADESDGSLLWLRPTVAILTNIDEEHLDFFRNWGEILETYALFANRVGPQGVAIGCADDRWVRRLLSSSGKRFLTYGFSPEAHVRGDVVETGAGWSRFDVHVGGKKLTRFKLQIPGIHNVVNALGVVALAQFLGIHFKVAQKALEEYRGADRRFQVQTPIDGVMVVEDYGHHPAEIAATLAAARQWPGRRLLCIFQPHRFSRTKYLVQRFGSAFDSADEVILLPIYAASEEPLAGVTSQRLLEAIRIFGKVPVSLEEPVTLSEKLLAKVRPGDILLFMGAGSIGDMSRLFMEELGKRGCCVQA